ncbi:MAG: multicopper oxidase domain-containing protein, partial [Gammaproteobacteria bacterium]|nr:multicopper oxidase domain-containing protein [Gammaproteobacteria bacterium]
MALVRVALQRADYDCTLGYATPMLTRRRFLAGSASLYGAIIGRYAFADANGHTEPAVLTAAPAAVPLVDADKPTRVWAYNGLVPGPLLRVNQGEKLRVKLRNRLPVGTTVHWHGIRIDNAMDGVANLTQPPVSQESEFEYAFVAPDAGTFWYHPHFRSSEAVGRGLYGLLIVDEPEPPQVDRDLPLALDDWRLNDNDQIDVASLGNLHDAAHQGRLGNVLSVNGLPAPEVTVAPGERLRLRLANTANSRVMTLDFGALSPQLIAIDGQPVSARGAPDARLILAPGQRADAIVDIDLEPAETTDLTVVTRGGTTPAVRFVASRQRLREQPLDAPISLPANPLKRRLELDSALGVELLMQGGAM